MAQATRRIAAISKDIIEDPRGAIRTADTVPLAPFTTVRNIAGPFRVRATTFIPRPRSTERRPAGYSRPGDRDHGELAAEGCRWVQLRVDDARVPADQGRQHRAVRLRACRGVLFSWCWRRSSESLTLPLGGDSIVPMCLVASISGVILRGQEQQHPHPGRVLVLIGLAARTRS